jgi:hypothetical protein
VIGQYKKTVVGLLAQLREFQNTPQNMGLLERLQRNLYQTLVTIERRAVANDGEIGSARRLSRNGRLEKLASLRLKAKIARLIERKDGYRDLFFLVKSIGDGIAFTLFDRFDLKPLAFKESPGAIGGKSGRRREFTILNAFLRRGMPAVLCDLTNVLRYGDICIKPHNLPVPIEVKSSKNSNARTERQLKSIGKMVEYLHTDQIEGLYGLPVITKREALAKPQAGHAGELHNLITRISVERFAAREVEPGLHYMVFRRFRASDFDKYFGSLREFVFQTLNSQKYNGAWSSHYPFTLSLEDIDQCFAFARGDFVIAIAFDMKVVQRMGRQRGFNISRERPLHAPAREGVPDDAYEWWITPRAFPDGSQGASGVSGHLVGRVFFEFASLKWLVHTATQGLKKMFTELVEKTTQIDTPVDRQNATNSPPNKSV